MIELAGKFVSATDEVWRLQNDDEPECRFFRRMVRGTDNPSRGTMQGTYVFAPSGLLLGRINSYSADATHEVLKRALETWEQVEEESKKLDLAEVAPGFRWEHSYPEDGLILLRTARDLPRDGDPKAEKISPSNRDAVWFSRSEARGWLPENIEVGARVAAQRVIADRLARLVLVDNVRGQTLPYHDDEVIHAAVFSEVTAIDGDLVTIEIRGETRAAAKGSWLYDEDNYWKPNRETPRSISTWMFGMATYDLDSGRFVAFEAFASGVRSGHTPNNGRAAKSKPGPIGFVLQLAPRDWRVAPTFINVYDVDWVKEPQ